MIKKITIEDFIVNAASIVIDVRSPLEYSHAHIPNAINIPLFTDEERKHIGTTYKQENREKAIKIGLDYFGPKMRAIVERVEELLIDKEKYADTIAKVKNSNTSDFTTFPPWGIKGAVIHCARGGMRSAAVAWLLNFYGIEVQVIEGGYKAYRNWTLQQFERTYPLKIIGGYTGSNKTGLLQELSKEYAVIDLEALANHRGSAYGGYGMPKQTSNEMFENKLALALYQHKDAATILVEDESQRIGFNPIPKGLWEQMRSAKVYFLDLPFAERLQNIVTNYHTIPINHLIEGTKKITKQLGGLETKTVIEYLENNNLEAAFAILLKYYDKYYTKGLESRLPSSVVKIESVAALKTLISSQC